MAVRSLVGLFAAYGAALCVILYTPFSDWLTRPLIIWPNPVKSDAIVLLAAWASPDGILNDQGLRRTIEAARLYARQVSSTVVISGRNRSSEAGPTARVMADLLVQLGVPPSALVLETDSTNTHESAVNVARIAKARGWSRVLLVSDAQDMRRALASFRHEALEAESGTSVLWALRTQSNPYGLLKVEDAMHEWLGLVYYWWEGWI